MIPLLQREIPHERITFMEEVGRGAFGRVHRGALRELPTVEIFDKPRDQRLDSKEAKVVAIKTLIGEQKEIYIHIWIYENRVNNRIVCFFFYFRF